MNKLKKWVITGSSRKALKTYLYLSLVLFFCCWVVLRWGISTFPYEASPLLDRKPSTVYYDRMGNPIWANLGENDVWQVPVSYNEISPNMVKAILSSEDKRFWQHGGIDYLRMIRATFSNMTSGRIVSGASTISMQLVQLTVPEKRSWGFKIRQIFMALQMEQNYSKKWIITQYLNHASFGSNLIGVEAASLYYFGKPCKGLNMNEATLLASLPQRPSFLRPDRFPKRALKRQKWVLEQVRENFPKTDVSVPTVYNRQVFSPTGRSGKLGFELKEPHYISLIEKKEQGGKVITCLDPILQEMVTTSLKVQLQQYPDVKDGAAVVIENRSGALLALVGTLDFHSVKAGQVNAATSRRSPGSTLKPFIYLNAIEQGLIIPETLINDKPICGRYQPGNFDGLYRGKVTATQALSSSLNTPAVRLLQETGVAATLDQLREFGITSLNKSASYYGLSLVLGGGEVSLLELTNAYATLARKGVFLPIMLVDHDESVPAGKPLVNPGSVELLTKMLSSSKLTNGANNGVAWKTGTSNGLHDAWCIGYTEAYTVGIWLGNKSGKASKNLIGSKVAKPVLASIFNKIYKGRFYDFPSSTHLEKIEITTESGLRAKAYHRSRRSAYKVKGIPLRFCQSSLAKKEKSSEEFLYITSPSGKKFFTNGGQVKLKLAANLRKTLRWFVNGELIATTNRPLWHNFKLGSYRLLCIDENGTYSKPFTIVVQ